MAVAVDLHFELAGSAKRARGIGGVTFSEPGAAFGSGVGGSSSSGGFGLNRSPQAARFLRREVVIAGLPAGWTAFVNEFSGRLEFTNCYTGEVQAQVPPGFADLPASDTGADGGSSTNHEEFNSDMSGNNDADDAEMPALVDQWPPGSSSPFHTANDRPLSEGAGFDFSPRTALGFGANATAAAAAAAAAAGQSFLAAASSSSSAHPFAAPPSFPPSLTGADQAHSSTSTVASLSGDFGFGSGISAVEGADASPGSNAFGTAPLDPQALPKEPEGPVDDSLDDSL